MIYELELLWFDLVKPSLGVLCLISCEGYTLCAWEHCYLRSLWKSPFLYYGIFLYITVFPFIFRYFPVYYGIFLYITVFSYILRYFQSRFVAAEQVRHTVSGAGVTSSLGRPTDGVMVRRVRVTIGASCLLLVPVLVGMLFLRDRVQ